MSTGTKRRSETAMWGAGILMVLCCAVGPAVVGAVAGSAVVGAVAGSAVGGWLGIACAVILAAGVGLVLHRRTRTSGGC